MEVQEMKKQPFSKVSLEEWKKTAEASLKGKPLEALHTATYEEISLKPLYRAEDVEDGDAAQYPGEPDYRRGFLKGGYMEKPWRNAHSLTADSPAQLQEKISTAMKAGQTALSFSGEVSARMTYGDFSELPLDEQPLYIDMKDHFLAFAAFLLKKREQKVSGAAGTDIVSLYAQKGLVPDKNILNLYIEAISQMTEALPQLKTIRIDTAPYQAAGANAYQEISIALAEAVFYIELFKEEGWTPAEIVEKMHIHFAIGSQFFMELAKLRAFRKAWTALCEAYGLAGDSVKVTVGAETSAFTLSRLDRHVNILRTGSEAFSALLGGVEFLQVTSFDQVNGQPSPLGERIARNIPLILQNESHVDKVIDPAGGSYYIETLTSELSQKAWGYFTDIEEAGGILAVLKDGVLQKELAAVLEKRKTDLALRKKSMIGTNVYADINEPAPTSAPVPEVLLASKSVSSFDEVIQSVEGDVSAAELHVQDSGAEIIPVKAERLAEPYERLRARAEALRADGKDVEAGLICLGKLKDFKPRADFVTGMLAVGGISAKTSGECHTVEEAVQFVKDSSLPYYCICGADASYEQFGPQLAEAIKQSKENVTVHLAGRLPEEAQSAWTQSGLNGSIYAGQNILEKLANLLDLLEGESAHE